MITSVFVYGTLKRGQCRELLWPAVPRVIRNGWTRGALFDRPDYPAMTGGTDRVRGELWTFDADQMASVLAALDKVESTGQPGQADLYLRVVTRVVCADNAGNDNAGDSDDKVTEAWTYHYATDPATDGFKRIDSDSIEDSVQWPPARDQASKEPPA